jgi:signal transduction histidine kinase
MEVIPHTRWYLKDNTFDAQRILKAWRDKSAEALSAGFAGVRAAGDLSWGGKGNWADLATYEHEVNETIGRYQMLGICAYPLGTCGPRELIDVATNHQFGLIKQDGNWLLLKNSERMRAEKRLLKYQSQLRSLASALSLIEERERHRIATELHDRVSQSLVASKIRLDAARDSASNREFVRTLEEVCNCLDRSIADVRSLTSELSSPVLYVLGLEKALEELLTEQIGKKHGVKTEFEDDGQPKHLAGAIAALLFASVRELLTNVVKHAHANRVKVSVCRVASDIHITVEDNGGGFDADDVFSTGITRGKYGLFGIREQMESLGGHLEVQSERGHGSRITIVAPLGQENSTRGG